MATAMALKTFNPPVKNACLSCRASRIRCDGKSPCRQCFNKFKSCVYTKSRRGGPRISNKKLKATVNTRKSSTIPPLEQDVDTGTCNIIINSMYFPGAGLNLLQFDDQSFVDHTALSISNSDFSTPFVQTVRNYNSDGDLLNAYYIFIHGYFPILPPPVARIREDNPGVDAESTYHPSSPLSLAIAAILALIPHPADLLSNADDARIIRREKSHRYAQLALEKIETDSDILESITCPGEALSTDLSCPERIPLHSLVPVELERLLALLLLSSYEYSQRGNMAKMRNRASQALDAALGMSLHHTFTSVGDQFREAKRRAWWMTYICVLQSSIVSGTDPIIEPDASSFSTPLPTIHGASDIWREYIDSQQIILRSSLHVTQLNTAVKSQHSLTHILDSMSKMDLEIHQLLARCAVGLVGRQNLRSESGEWMLAECLKTQTCIKLHSARIKLHRFVAFQDTAIFTRRYCDIQSTNENAARGPKIALHSTYSAPKGAKSSAIPEQKFDNITSARICLQSAIAISNAFEAMPYPIIRTQQKFSLVTYSPRTMPSFACCAMQASYVLLIICLKNSKQNQTLTESVVPELEKLYGSIERILTALDNYSLAFEAVQGMASQVRTVFDSLKRPTCDLFG